MYIRNPDEIKWIQNWLNKNDNHPQYDGGQKKQILKKLNQALSFETFLHSKYVGQKRFSIEGVDALIPGLDTLMEQGAEQGVEQFVVGMAHRGRLNVLTNIFGKAPEKIFSEFDSKEYDEAELFDGDVKYHMGWTSFRETNGGKKVRMDLAPNPSHLETVNAVVGGISRAKLDNELGGDEKKLLPILIHGDAAIAGHEEDGAGAAHRAAGTDRRVGGAGVVSHSVRLRGDAGSDRAGRHDHPQFGDSGGADRS